MDGEHQKRMCFREDRSALVESKNITQEIQVLGDILISLCSSLLNGKADKKRVYHSKSWFSIFGGNKQNRELFICNRRTKYAKNILYHFHRYRHPIMLLKKQQHVHYTTLCSDFESCGWLLVSTLNSYCYKISCITVIFAHQILFTLIHYTTTLTMQSLTKTLIFLSSRCPVRKKKSRKTRPRCVTHVKWSCKSLRK